MDNARVADVSVVIPCFKCADTIGRAVASINEQVLRPAEIILVEDCSEDNTLEVLFALQRNYPTDWIKVIPLAKNSGPSEARNAGWKLASHSFVAFLDADDSWHPQKIQIQYDWMMANPEVPLTGHDCRQCLNGDLQIHERFSLNDVPSRCVSKASLLWRNRFSTPSVMLRRDVGKRFARGKYHSEDYLLWLEIVCAGGAAYRIELPLAYLYKAPFGEGGLSAQLWNMQKGQLDTYRHIRRNGCVSLFAYWLLIGWSWARFLRRLVLSRLMV